jgi:lysophospholipase L1-like esterase
VLPGVSGEARFFTNSHGLRAEEATADREYHVLALGGSTTECLFLDQAEAWPRLVQDRLNRRAGPRVWLGNAGRSGMTSRDHRLHAQVLLRQEPKTDAIFLMAGINDLTIRLLRDDAYDAHYLEDPEHQAQQTQHAFAVSPSPATERDRTPELWKLLTRRARRSHPSAHSPEQYPVWRRRRGEATHIRDSLPDLTSALEEYARNLQAVIETSRAHGVRLLLLTQPTLWREDLSTEEQDLLWFGGVGDFMRRDVDTYYSAGALAQGMRLYNDTLLEVCRSSGLECLDVAAQLSGERSFF